MSQSWRNLYSKNIDLNHSISIKHKTNRFQPKRIYRNQFKDEDKAKCFSFILNNSRSSEAHSKKYKNQNIILQTQKLYQLAKEAEKLITEMRQMCSFIKQQIKNMTNQFAKMQKMYTSLISQQLKMGQKLQRLECEEAVNKFNMFDLQNPENIKINKNNVKCNLEKYKSNQQYKQYKKQLKPSLLNSVFNSQPMIYHTNKIQQRNNKINKSFNQMSSHLVGIKKLLYSSEHKNSNI